MSVELGSKSEQFITMSSVVQGLRKSVTRNSVYTDTNELLGTLMEFWYHSQQQPESDFATGMRSFEAFTASYLPDLDPNSKKKWVGLLSGYINHFDSGFLGLTVSGSASVSFQSSDRWIQINNERIGDQTYFDFVSRSLLAQVKILAESGYYTGDPGLYYHASGSAALSDIGEYDAILSSNRLLDKNREIKTGEFASVSWGGVLAHVYASLGARIGYATPRWFDEFGVVFGIDKDAMNEFCIQKGIPNPHHQTYIGNGILLGDEVPLSFVREIYSTSLRKVVDLADWGRKYCPNAKVLPYGVVELPLRAGISKEQVPLFVSNL